MGEKAIIWFWQHREKLRCSLNAFYHTLNISKQAIHQLLERRMKATEETAYLAVLISQVRLDHPTLSCRAMYYKITPKMGRDKFEQLCAQLGFNIDKPLSKPRTTDSLGVTRFENLMTNMVLSCINQAWSSDITYFEVDNKFYYITFIIDCYSRRILGYATSDRLLTEQTTLPALKRALKTRSYEIPEGLVFHSDGGGQYYDKNFISLTESYKIRNSMCEYAYENGKAERLNGIIKNNYLIHYNIKTYKQLVKSVDRSVQLYNQERPHKSLKYKTPINFENEIINLTQPTKLKMTESLDAFKILRGIEPHKI